MDAMLDQMTPEQWRERVAHHQIEPWGDEWAIGGTIARAIDGFALMVRQRILPQPISAMFHVWDYIPWPDWKKRKALKQYNAEQAKKAAKRVSEVD